MWGLGFSPLYEMDIQVGAGFMVSPLSITALQDPQPFGGLTLHVHVEP